MNQSESSLHLQPVLISDVDWCTEVIDGLWHGMAGSVAGLYIFYEADVSHYIWISLIVLLSWIETLLLIFFSQRSNKEINEVQ